jgi:tetratricopeptide (TPR) repeat protein
MRIAASVIIFLIAGGYWFAWSAYSDDQLYADSFATYPNQFSVMGSEEKNSFTDGLEHYDRGDYKEAIASFKNISRENEYFVPAQLYTGVSYLAMEQPDSAVTALNNLLVNETTYSDAARWYLALAYLKNEDESNAITLLESIVDRKGFQAHQAKELLQKLKSPLKKLPGI